MSGHYVHIPPKPHRCEIPPRESRDAIGAVWRCDECQTYWRFGSTDDSWGPVWYRPFWLNVLPEKWAESRVGK